MSLRIRRITSFSQLEGLRTQWNRLTETSPFGSWQWLHSWAETYISEEQLYVLVAETEVGELVGILPLYRDSTRWEGRTLRFLGSGEVCSDYLRLFARPDLQSRICGDMAEWLAVRLDDRDCGWESMLLDHVPATDSSIPAFTKAIEQFGISVMESDGENCWSIPLPESWDEYLSRLSRSHRKRVRKIERDFLKQGAGQLVTVQSETESRAAMDTLIVLHQKRRNLLGEPGCFASDRFTELMLTAGRRLLSAGMLRLQTMEVAGHPVAAEFQVQQGPTVFAYQAGIDPDAMELSPGNLIMVATIRRAIDSGCRSYDFLRGDEPYKPHFRALPQPTVTRRLFAPTARGKFTHTVLSISHSTKHFLKSSTSSSKTTA